MKIRCVWEHNGGDSLLHAENFPGAFTRGAGSIAECRERGFALLEQRPGFLENAVYADSYDEEWCLRKVLRRFLWHDRIHAKAMYRMAVKTFGAGAVPDVFRFEG